jgi:hypothetical protein
LVYSNLELTFEAMNPFTHLVEFTHVNKCGMMEKIESENFARYSGYITASHL